MAGKYLIEYIGTEGNVSVMHKVLGRVRFPENPVYKHRRIREFETSQIRDEILDQGNPHGMPPRYSEPTDILSAQDKSLVESVLREHGLIPGIPEEVKISPAAMELAVENEVDPTKVQGTGKDGTVTKADVEAAIEG